MNTVEQWNHAGCYGEKESQRIGSIISLNMDLLAEQLVMLNQQR